VTRSHHWRTDGQKDRRTDLPPSLPRLVGLAGGLASTRASTHTSCLDPTSKIVEGQVEENRMSNSVYVVRIAGELAMPIQNSNPGSFCI
jgi:hypothetical protein